MTGAIDRLKIAVQQAKAKLAAMSEEERQAMWQAQRESFVRGMTTPCEHGSLDFEQCPQCRSAVKSRMSAKPITLDVLKGYFRAMDAGDVPDQALALYSYLQMDGFISKEPAPAEQATVPDFATRLFDLHGFMLLETYRDKPAVTVTFPDLKQAQQFHDALVELSTHRPRQPAATGGGVNV